MIKINLEMAELFHQLIAQETGGAVGVRDEQLLDSALESAFQTFDGVDLYKTKEEKAAKLGYSLISNHAFVDGNKRIGMHIMLTFLELNGIKLAITNEDIVKVGLGVASKKMQYCDVLEWIINHKE